tara:strand:- start:39520 stop:39978 length:459 start_codon:yes stop_codon:yes gene_type:complete
MLHNNHPEVIRGGRQSSMPLMIITQRKGRIRSGSGAGFKLQRLQRTDTQIRTGVQAMSKRTAGIFDHLTKAEPASLKVTDNPDTGKIITVEITVFYMNAALRPQSGGVRHMQTVITLNTCSDKQSDGEIDIGVVLQVFNIHSVILSDDHNVG